MAINFGEVAKTTIYSSASGYAAAWALGAANPLAAAGLMAIINLVTEVTDFIFDKMKNGERLDPTQNLLSQIHYIASCAAAIPIANYLKLATPALIYVISFKVFADFIQLATANIFNELRYRLSPKAG